MEEVGKAKRKSEGERRERKRKERQEKKPNKIYKKIIDMVPEG